MNFRNCTFGLLLPRTLSWNAELKVNIGDSIWHVEESNFNCQYQYEVIERSQKKDAKMQKPDQVIRCNALRVP